jgi:hypothetical protein
MADIKTEVFFGFVEDILGFQLTQWQKQEIERRIPKNNSAALTTPVSLVSGPDLNTLEFPNGSILVVHNVE